jgi:hypothetical protein
MARLRKEASYRRRPRPSGLEALLQRAAADTRFRERLLSDREEAIAASGLELTVNERALLQSVTRAQLEQLIANTPRPVAPRRRFVAAAVGWLAALLGGSALLGGCGSPDDEPEPSPIRGSQPDPPVVTGVRPD